MELTDARQPIRIGNVVRLVLRDLGLVLLSSAALVLLIGLEPDLGVLAPVRILFGLAYVLFIPGFFLTMALFPGVDDLDGIERTGLSIGLSIAWLPLLALILDLLPWGLQLWPIMIGLSGSVLAFSAIGMWRRGRVPPELVFTPAIDWQPGQWWRDLPDLERNVYKVTFCALLLATLALGWTFVFSPATDTATQFYMLSDTGRAEEFPSSAVVGQDVGVTLGIANGNQDDRSYYVEVWVSDPWGANQSMRVIREGPYTLDAGETSEIPLTWRMPWAGEDQRAEILLFTGNDDEPYRSLRLVLDVTNQ